MFSAAAKLLQALPNTHVYLPQNQLQGSQNLLCPRASQAGEIPVQHHELPPAHREAIHP